MKFLHPYSRAVIIAGTGLLLLVAVAIGIFLSAKDIPTKSLAAALPYARTLLYLRSNDTDAALKTLTLLGGENAKNITKAVLPKDGWFEVALVQSGSGNSVLGVVRQGDRREVEDGTPIENLVQAGEISLEEGANMKRFVESEEREVAWYAQSLLDSDATKSIAHASLLGGAGLLILPDDDGKTGRTYVSGGRLPRSSLSTGIRMGSGVVLSVFLSSPHETLGEWFRSLHKSDTTFAEGIGGIIAFRLRGNAAALPQAMFRGPAMLAIVIGTDGDYHLLAEGEMQKGAEGDILQYLQTNDRSEVRTLRDEQGDLIQRGIVPAAEKQAPMTDFHAWSIATVPYAGVTESPLTVGMKDGHWIASDDRERVMQTIEEHEEKLVHETEPAALSMQMQMEGGARLLEKILPGVGKKLFELLETHLGEDVKSFEWKAQTVGNGFMVRWSVQKDSEGE